jgi:hypothetical protein
VFGGGETQQRRRKGGAIGSKCRRADESAAEEYSCRYDLHLLMVRSDKEIIYYDRGLALRLASGSERCRLSETSAQKIRKSQRNFRVLIPTWTCVKKDHEKIPNLNIRDVALA